MAVPEIRGIINYLRFLVDTNNDESLFEIMNWPKRGLGSSALETVKSLGCLREIPM